MDEPEQPAVPVERDEQPNRNPAAAPIDKRNSITDYTRAEMRMLYEWVASDGKLRTHDELADEMFAALPFARRGARIEAVLRSTIRACEKDSPN